MYVMIFSAVWKIDEQTTFKCMFENIDSVTYEPFYSVTVTQITPLEDGIAINRGSGLHFLFHLEELLVIINLAQF